MVGLGFVLEVPSGAWADTVERTRLLILSAGAFAIWMVWPTYPGFAAGFMLWAASSALASGTFEAWLYDALQERRLTGAYPRLIGWAHSAAMAATLVATLVSAPLLALGGYPLVGWTSVGLAGVQTALAWSLPRSSSVERAVTRSTTHEVIAATEATADRYLTMLRLGVREAARVAAVRHTVW